MSSFADHASMATALVSVLQKLKEEKRRLQDCEKQQNEHEGPLAERAAHLEHLQVSGVLQSVSLAGGPAAEWRACKCRQCEMLRSASASRTLPCMLCCWSA